MLSLAAYAAQDVAIERVEVRDPVRLEAFLEANASDAETRIAVLETSIGTNAAGQTVSLGALTSTGTVTAAQLVGGGAGVTNVAGTSLTGNVPLARITNAVSTTSGVKLTNDVIVAGGGTNRWIMVPLGTKYLVESVTGL
jgi:hypothetical protein